MLSRLLELNRYDSVTAVSLLKRGGIAVST
jgi:hypothetical protein